jgi:hypothetical protein
MFDDISIISQGWVELKNLWPLIDGQIRTPHGSAPAMIVLP